MKLFPIAVLATTSAAFEFEKWDQPDEDGTITKISRVKNKIQKIKNIISETFSSSMF